MTTDAFRESSEPSWPIVALLLLTLLVFGRSLTYDFVAYDDVLNLQSNPRYNPATLETFRFYWTHCEFDLYAPVTFSFWGIIAMLSRGADGLDATPFRAANLVLHLLTVYLAYRLLRRFTRGSVSSAIGAAIVALHPLQVETVCWPSGTKDLLAACFATLCIWQFVVSRQKSDARALLLSFIAFVLAILAKPQVLVLPLALAAVDVFLLDSSLRGTLRKLWWWAIPMIACALWTQHAQPAPDTFAPEPWKRIFVAGDAIWFYLHKLFKPFPLTIDYGRLPKNVLETGGAYWTFALASLLIITVLSLCWRWRRSTIAAGLILFLIPFLPVMGWMPFAFQRYSTVADHYAYVAMLGPALLVARALDRRMTRVDTSLTFTVIAILAISSAWAARVWKNPFTLYTNATNVNPRSFMGWNNLGDAHSKSGNLSEAARCFELAMEVNPDWHESIRNLSEVQMVMAQQEISRGNPTLGKALALEAAKTRRKAREILSGRVPETLQESKDDLFEAEARLLGGDVDGARTILAALHQRFPDSPTITAAWEKAFPPSSQPVKVAP